MFFFKFFVWFVLFFVVMVIFSMNVLYAILSLVFISLTGCFFLLLLEIEFLSFILMLLYIGAIIILFLFVVMMIPVNKDKIEKLNKLTSCSNSLWFMLFGFKCFHFSFWFNTQLSRAIKLFYFKFLHGAGVDYSFTNPLLLNGDSVIFCIVFTQKYVLFLLIALILLFSMVGSIVLCSRFNT